MAVIVTGLLASLLAPSVPAPPLVPYEAFGIAQNETGAPLPLGSPVRTFIDGVDYSNLTATYHANGSYQTRIVGNWFIGPTSETPLIKEGGNPNDPIMFTRGDFTTSGAAFRQSAPWVSGGFQNLNLREAAASKQPALIKIQSITVASDDSLSQYAYICNPGTAPVDLSNYYFEKNIPGFFNGPTVALTGVVQPGQTLFADFLSTTYLDPNGDAVKLVFVNPDPLGVDSPFGGEDVIVDRVEFNASAPNGALDWEPGNTIMTNAPALGFGQEVYRNPRCADTNSGSDFLVGPETGRPTAPRITVTTPAGGERWTAGSTHNIVWTLVDDQDPPNSLIVNASWTTDRNSYTSIFSNRAGSDPLTFPWPVPATDTSTAQVLVCAVDPTNLLGCGLSNQFAIDNTAPFVISATPSGTGVDPDADIEVRFSETMNKAAVEAAFDIFTDPGPTTKGFQWSSQTFTDDTLRVPLNTMVLGRTYTVTIGTSARDASDPGKFLVPEETWQFTVLTNALPTVSIDDPTGGCWSGGFPHHIAWTMQDVETLEANLVVYVNYTSVQAGDGQITPGPLVGATFYDWTPVGLDATDVRIVVTVIDERGGVGSATSFPIEVDSTAPSIVTRNPTANQPNVPLGQAIVIEFSELMDQGSVSAGFSITSTTAPPVTGIALNWVGRTLTVPHDAFTPGTTYTIMVTGATDDCDPGIPMPEESWQFTTAANTAPTADVTAPTAGATFAPGNQITIRWTMSDAETAEADLVVYINYTSSAGSGSVSTRLQGDTSFVWTAPDIDSGNVVVQVTVIDEAGASVTAESEPFAIRRGGIDLAIAAGLGILIVVIALLLLFLLMKRRKKEAPEEVPEEAAAEEEAPPPPRRAPPRAPAAPAARAPPVAPAAPASAGTRECPSCGTIVDVKDDECFMCGHKF